MAPADRLTDHRGAGRLPGCDLRRRSCARLAHALYPTHVPRAA